MNLYILTWDLANTEWDYYDSIIVAAQSPKQARFMHPSKTNENPIAQVKDPIWENNFAVWETNPEKIEIKLIGKTNKYKKPYIILKSFIAG